MVAHCVGRNFTKRDADVNCGYRREEAECKLKRTYGFIELKLQSPRNLYTKFLKSRSADEMSYSPVKCGKN
jgi:hypothetical protein